MVAVTERFSDRAAAYAAARPSYPEAVALDLKKQFALTEGAWVADLGSGTGLSSLPFLRAGFSVIGVEPNAAMRAIAEKDLAAHARFSSANGTAEASTLAPHSVDLVIAAQAAHWFDAERARLEALRILRRPAWAALIWNERASEGSAFAEGYEQLLRDFGVDYLQVRQRHACAPLIEIFFGGAVTREQHYAHELALSFDLLHALLESASYLPRAGQPAYAEMMQALQTLFDDHAVQGQVRMQYVARVFAAEIQAP